MVQCTHQLRKTTRTEPAGLGAYLDGAVAGDGDNGRLVEAGEGDQRRRGVVRNGGLAADGCLRAAGKAWKREFLLNDCMCYGRRRKEALRARNAKQFVAAKWAAAAAQGKALQGVAL